MTRLIDFRYIVVRNDADFCELYPAEGSAPTIRMDQSSEIKTSLSGTFVRDDRFLPLSDELRAELILDGVPHSLGIFAVSECSLIQTETEKTMQLEAFDRCWRVRDTYTESSPYYPAGSNYIGIITSLLVSCGFANIIATPTDSTLTEARQDWQTGTSYLEIINSLLSEINYNPLWFNADGIAILEPASVPSSENIDHELDAADIHSLMLPEIERTTDVYSAPNVFVCVCSNADKSGPMVAKAENTNPQSPLSIQRRGRRIMKVEQVSNIASQAELQAYANRLRNESMISGETIKVSTALFPGYGVADVVAIKTEEVFAVCIERAWEMSLIVGGTMQHTLEKVVINIG